MENFLRFVFKVSTDRPFRMLREAPPSLTEARITIMRIPGSNGPDRGSSIDRARSSSSSKRSGASGGSSGGAGKSGSVTASVSARARSLAADHGVDVDKVERLREAIQSGSFQMDFQAIAERIVQDGAA